MINLAHDDNSYILHFGNNQKKGETKKVKLEVNPINNF